MKRLSGTSACFRLCAGPCLLFFALLFPATAPADQDPVPADHIPRHPLEIEALTEPGRVIARLPAEIDAARKAGDRERLALLYLAEANACRVVADWACQRRAGGGAAAAAKAADRPILAVRGLIAEGRASIAVQDFTRGERLLGEAQVLLDKHPFPELSGDVFLAYSSLSYSLGKHALAAEYSERGLQVLGDEPALSIRIRLLRNLARAQAQLGQSEQARASLGQAQKLSETHSDPKLTAELYLEAARMARLANDVPTQVANARRVLELATQLRNSQLDGLGREALGLAAESAGELDHAELELRASFESFRKLGLDRDELRVLRELIKVMLKKDRSGSELNVLMSRFLERSHLLEQAERAQASDDFEAKLKYAAQELDVVRLEAEAMLAQEREQALARTQRLTLALGALGVLVLVVLAVFFQLQRRSNRRLQQALEQQQASEQRYRILADNSRDLVVRMRPDGQRLYVSPSASEMLGISTEDLQESRWDLVHPEDLDLLRDSLRRLGSEGGTAAVVYRARHRDGHYIWIEALARRVDGPDGQHEIVYSGRDVSERVRAEAALEKSELFLRNLTDRIPASITYVDADERIRFANEYAARATGFTIEGMLGRTVREVRGEDTYERIRPQVQAALAGEIASFEGSGVRGGRHHHYQSSYVPDRASDGSVRGFFALTFDITALKNAEHELARMARVDSLTGVANRRQFDERLAAAISRGKRHGLGLALLCLDIDHFKAVNDSRGHPAGDQVIREFARRLSSCVREEDLVARLGGDEFAVLIEEAGTAEGARAVAAKLVALMQEDIALEGGPLRASTSIGIAWTRTSRHAERLLASADEALYAAKAAGRNTFRMVEYD
jgi:diguanylate cyclase (GGDEF)-like protein/PAS domain S-box-containing protein